MIPVFNLNMQCLPLWQARARQPNVPTIGWYQIITVTTDQFELNILALAPSMVIHILRQVIQSTQHTPGLFSHLEGYLWSFREYLQRKLNAV